MVKEVCFIHRGGPEVASFRYRAKIPADYLNSVGIKTFINQPRGNVAIFSKPYKEDLELAEGLKGQIPIIVDLCDNHFDKEGVGELYRNMAELADYLVCPTDVQAEIIYKHTGRASTVIGDPYEFEEVEPHANGDKLMWFGHKVNLKSLGKLPAVYDIKIVSGPGDIQGVTFYSPQNLRRAFLESNIALFPTQPGGENKSNNRVLNALRMGLFPICGNHPSYEELDMVWRGSVHTGIRWAKAFPEDLNDLVKEGQDYIRDRFSRETMGEKWKKLLDSI